MWVWFSYILDIWWAQLHKALDSMVWFRLCRALRLPTSSCLQANSLFALFETPRDSPTLANPSPLSYMLTLSFPQIFTLWSKTLSSKPHFKETKNTNFLRFLVNESWTIRVFPLYNTLWFMNRHAPSYAAKFHFRPSDCCQMNSSSSELNKNSGKYLSDAAFMLFQLAVPINKAGLLSNLWFHVLECNWLATTRDPIVARPNLFTTPIRMHKWYGRQRCPEHKCVHIHHIHSTQQAITASLV